MLRTWRDRDWILPTPGANGGLRGQSKAKIGKEGVWLIKITRQAVEAVEEEPEG